MKVKGKNVIVYDEDLSEDEKRIIMSNFTIKLAEAWLNSLNLTEEEYNAVIKNIGGN